MSTNKWLIIDYTNHRGERRERVIEPTAEMLYFGRSEWHNGEQWLLRAWDQQSHTIREFALTCIHSIRDYEERYNDS